jgi:hypothetical protein
MHCYHRFLLLVILLLSGEKIFCQTDYESMSKKEMKALLFKKDSLIQHHENQISIYKDLTIDLNNKILLKKDSIVSYTVRINQLISEKNNLDLEVKRLKKENSELVGIKNEMNLQITLLNTEIGHLKAEKKTSVLKLDSLSDLLGTMSLVIDSLEKEKNQNITLGVNSDDILNKIYFENDIPSDLRCKIEFEGVVLTSLVGRKYYQDTSLGLDNYIRLSHGVIEYDQWNRKLSYEDLDWKVFYPSEFIPKSKLEIYSTGNGALEDLSFELNLIQKELVTIKNDLFEKDSFLSSWTNTTFNGKKIVEWNLAHGVTDETDDLILRIFEIESEAYLALTNFQLMRLNNGFCSWEYDSGQPLKCLQNQSKTLKRLKDQNSESLVLDPAYCIYLFKLVK